MAGRPPEGAWFYRSADRYETRGGFAQRGDGGWYGVVGRKVRGPLSSALTAMEVVDKMLADLPKVEA